MIHSTKRLDILDLLEKPDGSILWDAHDGWPEGIGGIAHEIPEKAFRALLISIGLRVSPEIGGSFNWSNKHVYKIGTIEDHDRIFVVWSYDDSYHAAYVGKSGTV
jgi:hypothetical protein